MNEVLNQTRKVLCSDMDEACTSKAKKNTRNAETETKFVKKNLSDEFRRQHITKNITGQQ